MNDQNPIATQTAPEIPKICGTCDRRDQESGACLFWCCHVVSTATCEHWKLAEEDEPEKAL